LAFDDKGNLFVVDCSTIFKFTPDGKRSTFASGLGPSEDLAFDNKGNLFVSDGDSDSIFKFTPDGKRSTFASGFGRPPENLAFDDKGNLFVSLFVDEHSSHLILKFTPEGVKNTFATGLGSSPGDMAFDRSGNLFVTDTGNNSILKFTPEGVRSTFATGIHFSDMAFDASGNLFVSEWGDLIFKFTPDGTRSTFASVRISPDTQWEYQYSADGENPRIAKAGTTETVLDLSEKVPSHRANEAKIVWAPDSKRFALNYKADDSSIRTLLYQLRGEKWVALRSPETDETSKPLDRAQSAQLRKMHLPKNSYPSPESSTWEVTQWTDANTAILNAYIVWSVGNMQDLETHFLFTLKFDVKGNWKIVKTHQMSDEEIAELQLH
jgi:sugar lactone lactonase YvrE